MRQRRPLENGTLMPSFLDGNVVGRIQELERTARGLERLGLTSSAAASAYERRYLLDGWGDENIVANRSAARLFRFGNGVNHQRAGYVARGGRVTAIALTSNEARTAGTATLELYVAGSATGVTAVLDDGATTHTWETCDVSFEGGEALELYLSTSSWGPTTADMQACIEVVPG